MKSRSARQCRERWNNYLSPNHDHGPWTKEEDVLLDDLIIKYGSKWTKIVQHFPKRTANVVRNRFKQRARLIAKNNTQKEANKYLAESEKCIESLVLFNIIQSLPEDEFTDPFDYDKNPFQDLFSKCY
ncbi:Myb-like DNA-binding domain containing protein [Trichomonas vaginalis G3]|uniref:Myb-like DNA-binding domain containing protein n=1 Tax=Trichomonas vaginalis (strain ATCC PRA-98 / G3) TaxID=412133 RepID=A2E6S7_TRIV3|nr:RNA polymerase II transcription regulator recruiting protein [Trichomonas vaginalis G3]EAY11671.1 Myb-like DNA-binding domain containing protein [Trichomonas vaginalis G3]KAI5494924.1 RNA polymerase II transcription regulator recruiting protein [Trichomonas vaginalis G3]|eukprot:XP_001323894.1 Myb-like DNA-binding domain containing protein [Trichomonas vaginalis G3]